ncbi:MAG: hypothetical protein HKM93_08495 [Desulfobacteraceae bacterium]|nr:hypothetical protein [Desulfobacteraceae bacterium]
MKSSKPQISAKFHKIPTLHFEDQRLTSSSGLLIFQLLFKRIDLKNKLKKCFEHLKIFPIFGPHLIVMLLIVHLIIGFHRLRELDYYRDDPIVLRLMGLRKLPDVSTISRTLSKMDTDGVEKVRLLSRSLVIEGLGREKLPRITLDFDGPSNRQKAMRKVPPLVLTKLKKGLAVTIHCFALLRRPDSFSIFTTGPETFTIPMAPTNSC